MTVDNANFERQPAQIGSYAQAPKQPAGERLRLIHREKWPRPTA
jgi:hypothetical protein